MKKTLKISLIGIAACILTILIVLSIMYIQAKTGQAVSKIYTIDLAINNVPQSALIFIAQEKGFFNERGLNVNYHSFATGKLALDALVTNAVDMATTADVPITLAALAGQEISVIATIEYSSNNIQVVARKDSGIGKPTDLKGKKIGTTSGGGPLFFTYKFLEKYGLTVNQVKIVTLNPSDMVSALMKKDIDAFIVFEPFPYLAKTQLGTNSIIFAEADIYGESWNLVTMRSYKNKNLIIRFITSLKKAKKYLDENPQESLDIISKYSEIKQDILPQIMASQNINLIDSSFIIDSLISEAKWAQEKGLTQTKNIPDFRTFIDSNYLTQANLGEN